MSCSELISLAVEYLHNDTIVFVIPFLTCYSFLCMHFNVKRNGISVCTCHLLLYNKYASTENIDPSILCFWERVSRSILFFLRMQEDSRMSWFELYRKASHQVTPLSAACSHSHDVFLLHRNVLRCKWQFWLINALDPPPPLKFKHRSEVTTEYGSTG